MQVPNEQLPEQHERKYEVTITGNGITVKREIGEAKARQIIDLLLSPHTTISPPPSPPLTPGAAAALAIANQQRSTDRISLAEYLESVNARSNPEKILAMAVFLTKITGQRPDGLFGRHDIRPCFRLAGEPLPANFSRDFQLATQMQWIAPEGADPNVFFVTRRGEAAIEQRFSSETKRNARSRRRRASAVGEPDDETLDSEELDTDQNGT